MKDVKIVCVLGMHRSGTSMLTGLLNILGVFLGPEDSLLQPLADNPKGFWEHTQIKELNEEVLAAVGGSWDAPPDMPLGWERRSNLECLVTRAENVIHDDFAEAKLWGWKDPRTCLTLPFWQRLLPSIRYIICLRHPVDVASSLERRDGFPIEKGIYLWLSYLKAMLQHTEHEDRLLMLYEELVGNWQLEIKRLSEFLGMSGRESQQNVVDKVRLFIDQDLQHHQSRHLPVMNDPGESALSQALMIAEEIYNVSKQHRFSQLNAMREKLDMALELLRPIVRVLEAEYRRREQETWSRKSQLLAQDIEAIIPQDDVFILVDEARLETDGLLATHAIPFIEGNGGYWGRPANDKVAIEELERLRQRGAGFIVFAWPSFWWFDHYAGFRHHLKSKFNCIMKNKRVVVFDLKGAE